MIFILFELLGEEVFVIERVVVFVDGMFNEYFVMIFSVYILFLKLLFVDL